MLLEELFYPGVQSTGLSLSLDLTIFPVAAPHNGLRPSLWGYRIAMLFFLWPLENQAFRIPTENLVSHTPGRSVPPSPTVRADLPRLCQTPCQSQGNMVTGAVPPPPPRVSQPRGRSRPAEGPRRWGQRGTAHSPLPTTVLRAHPAHCPPHSSPPPVPSLSPTHPLPLPLTLRNDFPLPSAPHTARTPHLLVASQRC